MTTRPLLVTAAGGLLGLALSWPLAQAYTSSGAPPSAAGTASVQVAPAPAGSSASTPGASTGAPQKPGHHRKRHGSSATPGTQKSAAPTTRRLVATGPSVPNRYGAVQVKAVVEVTGRTLRIADVKTLQVPTGGTSDSINGYAAPQLRHEALAAQSAHVHTVSGASYTSDGYRRSLQSALDAARKAAGI